jgi:hypothetical protein
MKTYGGVDVQIHVRNMYKLKQTLIRRNFVSKRKGLGEKFRTLHNQNFRNVYKRHIIVRIVKCRRLRWAVQVAWTRGGGARNSYKNVWK